MCTSEGSTREEQDFSCQPSSRLYLLWFKKIRTRRNITHHTKQYHEPGKEWEDMKTEIISSFNTIEQIRRSVKQNSLTDVYRGKRAHAEAVKRLPYMPIEEGRRCTYCSVTFENNDSYRKHFYTNCYTEIQRLDFKSLRKLRFQRWSREKVRVKWGEDW